MTICYGSSVFNRSVEAADLLEPIIDFTLLWVKCCLSSSHQIYDVESIQSIRIRWINKIFTALKISLLDCGNNTAHLTNSVILLYYLPRIVQYPLLFHVGLHSRHLSVIKILSVTTLPALTVVLNVVSIFCNSTFHVEDCWNPDKLSD